MLCTKQKRNIEILKTENIVPEKNENSAKVSEASIRIDDDVPRKIKEKVAPFWSEFLSETFSPFTIKQQRFTQPIQAHFVRPYFL
jgi:hypothetical protein